MWDKNRKVYTIVILCHVLQRICVCKYVTHTFTFTFTRPMHLYNYIQLHFILCTRWNMVNFLTIDYVV